MNFYTVCALGAILGDPGYYGPWLEVDKAVRAGSKEKRYRDCVADTLQHIDPALLEEAQGLIFKGLKAAGELAFNDTPISISAKLRMILDRMHLDNVGVKPVLMTVKYFRS